LVIGAIIVAALLSTLASRSDTPPEAAVPAAPPAAAPAAPVVPAEPAAPPAPEGAGVIAIERDAKPVLKVYFDTGKANVTPDFGASAAAVLAYLEANPNAKLAISGYNDPTGNAAANAELSKNRAQNVKAAIEALGVAPERALLEKPAETTSTGVSNAEARRVEVVIRE
jgi:outer membrane protein OmpA-like peptidoglycan-associated protein